ncbi:hypothetical protein GCM10020255_018780 [Rhodococcus baikonurensis]
MLVNDDDRQKALEDVEELARLLHALRGLSVEVEALLVDAMKIARSSGLSQALIAEAAALSPGRVSQVVKSEGAVVSRSHLHDRVFNISEWPGLAPLQSLVHWTHDKAALQQAAPCPGQ